MINETQAAAAAASATETIKGFEWDDATTGAAVKVIDVLQAMFLPWLKRLTPTLGEYAEVWLQTVEDLLRKMLPPT